MSVTIFCWNVWGLNGRARRDVVRSFIELHSASVVCLQETKLTNVCDSVVIETLGNDFDYVCVPSVGASGGLLLAWQCSAWSATHSQVGAFSVSVSLTPTAGGTSWSVTTVYGPQGNDDKVLFLAEVAGI